ncbi:hypothetical protein ACFW1A_18515 [Kitasatospora sp. NPDC058965]|uniref:hypothetical protein n=1 Tax=Kitasatospora sp. NPDC058965 TaxID=3346682 RepID=UPI00367C8A67
MSKRLATIGAALVIVGPFNLTGYGTITSVAGVVVLLGAAVAWAVTRRRTSTSGRR